MNATHTNKKKTWRKRWPFLARNMKRVIALILAGLLAVATIVAALFSAYGEPAPESGRDQYTMEIELLSSYGGARVNQQVTYTNRTGACLTHMIFSLPGNAYRRSTTAPFEPDAQSDAYPEGFSPGGVDFFSVLVDGEAASWGVTGQAEDVLAVRCDLGPGESAVFSFAFEVLLPDARGEFGASSDTWMLSGFYPRAAVYDELLKEFVPVSLSAVGESLYADGADYAVTLTTPELYDLAATGAYALIERADGTSSWSIDGENLRDMTIVLSRKTRAVSGGNLTVKTGSRAAESILQKARDILDTYEALFGPLPYDGFTIIETDSLRAYSHCGLIALPRALFDGPRDELYSTLAYHIARQYFGLWVMNNPDTEPWLSEAISSYVALLYIERAQGYDAFLLKLNELVLDSLQMTLAGSLYVDGEKARFLTEAEYDLVIRRRGAAVMHELRDSVGDEAFTTALKLYIEARGGGIGSIADFAAALNAASESEMDLYLMEMLRTIGDYANQRMEYYE